MTLHELTKELGKITARLVLEADNEVARTALSSRYLEFQVVVTPVRAILIGVGNRDFPGNETETFIAGETEDGYVVLVQRRDVGIVSAMEYLEPVLDKLEVL